MSQTPEDATSLPLRWLWLGGTGGCRHGRLQELRGARPPLREALLKQTLLWIRIPDDLIRIHDDRIRDHDGFDRTHDGRMLALMATYTAPTS